VRSMMMYEQCSTFTTRFAAGRDMDLCSTIFTTRFE
jgi:hypothetical protein